MSREAAPKTKLKPQVYEDPRPAEHFARYHRRARERGPDWVYELCRFVLTPYIAGVYRARARGIANVPPWGPAIVAPNHFSFLDHFFIAVYLRRKVRFVAKSQLFKPPLDFILSHGGAFPIRRGVVDEEAFTTAHTVLRQGGLVVMYAEAGRSRTGELGRPRWGLGRLALESGVPVVPTAIVGTERARDWRRLRFPQVTIAFGGPLAFERVERPRRQQSQRASEIVFDRVRALHSQLRAEHAVRS